MFTLPPAGPSTNNDAISQSVRIPPTLIAATNGRRPHTHERVANRCPIHRLPILTLNLFPATCLRKNTNQTLDVVPAITHLICKYIARTLLIFSQHALLTPSRHGGEKSAQRRQTRRSGTGFLLARSLPACPYFLPLNFTQAKRGCKGFSSSSS